MELYLTLEDNKEFQKILTGLEAEKALLSKKLAEVAAFGGSFPAGIPEYAAIENQIGIIDSQINSILKALDKYEVVEESKIPSNQINNYSLVRVEEIETGDVKELYLLDMNLAKAKETPKNATVVTPFSPLGKALIGKKKNDVVEVTLPKGNAQFKILEVEKTLRVSK